MIEDDSISVCDQTVNYGLLCSVGVLYERFSGINTYIQRTPMVQNVLYIELHTCVPPSCTVTMHPYCRTNEWKTETTAQYPYYVCACQITHTVHSIPATYTQCVTITNDMQHVYTMHVLYVPM